MKIKKEKIFREGFTIETVEDMLKILKKAKGGEE